MGLKDKRLEFHQVLADTVGTEFHLYYQPPENLKLVYPCIIYSRRYIYPVGADNRNYRYDRQYMVTLISKNMEEDVIEKLLELSYSRYSGHSIVDGLHHDTFEIYY